MHVKFVDALTLVETINLRENLVLNPDRALPDTYHERLGTKLDPEKHISKLRALKHMLRTMK